MFWDRLSWLALLSLVWGLRQIKLALGNSPHTSKLNIFIWMSTFVLYGFLPAKIPDWCAHVNLSRGEFILETRYYWQLTSSASSVQYLATFRISEGEHVDQKFGMSTPLWTTIVLEQKCMQSMPNVWALNMNTFYNFLNIFFILYCSIKPLDIIH